MKRTATFLFALALLASLPADAANFGATDTFRQEFPLDFDGLVVIDNPFGNIDVTAADTQTVRFVAQKVVRGGDASAIAEARDQTALVTSGDAHSRLIKTQVPLLHNQRWTSMVNYVVTVPKWAQVKIVSNSGERIHVAGISGWVNVKNWNGQITIDNVAGATVVDSLNGNIAVSLANRPTANLQLTTVNGRIVVTAPAESAFRWVAQTVKGALLSTFPVAGKFSGPKFVGNVRGGGPMIATASMMGDTAILRRGSRVEQARSMRSSGSGRAEMASLPVQTFQKPQVDGDFIYSTALGNISVGRIRGAARVETRAGEVQLGVVQGQCDIVSSGGPLTLGDVFGPLSARTSAGDVSVNAARQGAIISTGGGMIRMLWANGPLNLRTEGGDIVVRQAMSAVAAETRSGDVTVSIDPTVRAAAIDLKTSEGTVVLNVGTAFAADIEATVVTSDPDADPIHSDFNGLTIDRKTVGGKTRIHAVGKVNGGGDRVTLYAEEGDIHLNAVPVSALSSRNR